MVQWLQLEMRLCDVRHTKRSGSVGPWPFLYRLLRWFNPMEKVYGSSFKANLKEYINKAEKEK